MLGQLAGDDGESTGVIPVKEYTLGTITVTSLGTLIGGPVSYTHLRWSAVPPHHNRPQSLNM